MSPCELVTSVSSLACAIANEFTEEETALLATIFTQLGDSLTTVLAAKACKSN